MIFFAFVPSYWRGQIFDRLSQISLPPTVMTTRITNQLTPPRSGVSCRIGRSVTRFLLDAAAARARVRHIVACRPTDGRNTVSSKRGDYIAAAWFPPAGRCNADKDDGGTGPRKEGKRGSDRQAGQQQRKEENRHI